MNTDDADRKLAWLRAGYWVSAIADFVIAGMSLIPQLAGVDRFVYPMGMMSAVAVSWGVLLIIAVRKPYERRWVLIPTMLVVALLALVTLASGLAGLIPLWLGLPGFIAGVLVFSLLVYGYRRHAKATSG
jgi:hypothetical protein